MYIQNRLNSSNFKGCSPLQNCNSLISLKPEIAYFAYTNRYRQLFNKIKMFSIMKKVQIFILVILGSISLRAQESIFNALPFNIVVGKTTGEEIENRGKCEKEIKISEYRFRCEKYNMADKFIVYCSQNEIVNKVHFFANANHSFPKKWRESGLILAKGTVKGSGKEDYGSISSINLAQQGISSVLFKKILEEQNVDFNEVEYAPVHGGYSSTYTGGEWYSRTKISFVLGVHEFHCMFVNKYEFSGNEHERKAKWDSYKERVEWDKKYESVMKIYMNLEQEIGLIDLEITESY